MFWQITSATFRVGRSDGGDIEALFASEDGSFDLTKLSELPLVAEHSERDGDSKTVFTGIGGGDATFLGTGDVALGVGEVGRDAGFGF